ncbi:DMT family transporter [Paenibacillus sp. GCM10027628]|uniref:DMT family transporter n=1 Tax=Paenibacillus sp. GCM10027628 TaxID=3273413 RepID=UPI00362E94C4
MKNIVMLFTLAALWGASYFFIRIGSPALGPAVLMELRVILAGMMLILIAQITGHRIHILHKWRQYLLLGLLNAAFPFTLIATAETHLSASLAAILIATSPLFTTIVALLWNKEPLSLRKLTGVVMGIIGVTVLTGWNSNGDEQHNLLSILFLLIAALFYAISGVFSSKYFKGEKPMDLAIGQQAGASIVLLPLAAFAFSPVIPSSAVILSVLGLSFLCTAGGYLLFFALIQSVGALKALTVNFLIPLFGLMWGALFLREQVSLHLVIGLLIILISVMLVMDVRLIREKKKSISSKGRRESEYDAL